MPLTLLRRTINNIQNSAFVKRLGDSFPLFFFILALQVVVNVTYLLQLDPDEVTTIVNQGIVVVGIKGAIHALFWASLAWVGCSLFPLSWMRKTLWVISLLGASVLYFTEAIVLKSYNMVFNNITASIILSSNPKEANAFRETVLKWDYLSVPVMTFVAVVLGAIFVWGITRWLIRIVRESYFSLFLSGVSLVGLVLGVVYVLPQLYNNLKYKSYLYEMYAPIERIYVGIRENLEEVESMERSLPSLRADVKRDQIRKDGAITTPHTLVLIVGESLGSRFMHCYGYPLENTPNMDRRIAAGEIIPFSQVISAAPSTSASLTASFTLHTSEETNVMWYERPALHSVFARTGYWVYWLSNTERFGGITLPTTTLSLLADESLFTTVQSSRNFYNRVQDDHDERALPHLKSHKDIEKDKGRQNMFQILHLMGSHHTYSDRYPERFNKFRPEDVPVHRTAEKDLIVAQYNNSVLYNDYIIDEVIKRYESEDAIVVYFSDHGQTLYELPNNPDKFDHDLSELGLSVPFMVYMSPSMKAQYPELYDKVQRAKDKRIMLDLLAHSLCELMGIKTKYSNPKMEFFSDEYDDTRVRVARGYGQSINL